MKKIVRGLAALLSAGIVSLLTLALIVQCQLPDNFQVVEGEEFSINARLSIKAKRPETLLQAAVTGQSGETYSLKLNLFENVAVKQVQVQVVSRKMVVPGGIPFGIKMFTDGVMVVGMSDIQTGSTSINPAREAGLKIGDILLSIDGRPLSRNEDVANCVSASGGNPMTVTLRRGSTTMEVSVNPVKTDYDNRYKAGIWVRDSSAGIGTLTYYDPQTMGFAGLGHAICDIDTGKLMPLSSGEIVDVNISGVNAGQAGKPGELRGTFAGGQPMGMLYENCELGVYGTLSYPCIQTNPVPMALRHEVTEGPATILSTISGNKPQEFDIVVEKINYSDSSSNKNMVIKITDPKLLTATGGIVQGMSGSPILQNGRLIGAITHVFVNDPTRGYAIFAESMDKELNNVESGSISA